jgi:hypothetical protein
LSIAWSGTSPQITWRRVGRRSTGRDGVICSTRSVTLTCREAVMLGSSWWGHLAFTRFGRLIFGWLRTRRLMCFQQLIAQYFKPYLDLHHYCVADHRPWTVIGCQSGYAMSHFSKAPILSYILHWSFYLCDTRVISFLLRSNGIASRQRHHHVHRRESSRLTARGSQKERSPQRLIVGKVIHTWEGCLFHSHWRSLAMKISSSARNRRMVHKSLPGISLMTIWIGHPRLMQVGSICVMLGPLPWF